MRLYIVSSGRESVFRVKNEVNASPTKLTTLKVEACPAINFSGDGCSLEPQWEENLAVIKSDTRHLPTII